MPKRSKVKNGKDARRCSSDNEHLPPKQSRSEDSNTPSPLCFHSPASLFESLIQPMKMEEFFKEYWEKKPLHLQRSDPRTASYYQSLFQLSDLRSQCSQGLEYYTDINVVRCINGKKKVLNKEGQVKNSVLSKNLVENKATIQFHQPQRFKDDLWRIQEKLECFFGALVGSNIYITPQESQGLPVHYDDVEAGDLLYFPRGTIHQAKTPVGVDHSTHLTLSTYQKMSWGDLLLDIFPSLLCDSSRTEVSLREGIPRQLLLGSSEGLDNIRRLATELTSLADKMETGLQEVRSTHMKRDFISNRLPPYSQEELVPSGKIPALEDVVHLRFKEHMVITVEPSHDRTDEATELVIFVLHSLKNQRESHMMGESCDAEVEQDISRGLQFPLSHLQALRQLQEAEQLAVAQLQLPTQADKLNLTLALWSESLLVVVEHQI